MTPAIQQAKKARIHHTIHKYKHDPGNRNYGLEAAEQLDLSPDQVFKTLVVELEPGKLGVAVIPVSGMLNLKALAKTSGYRKARMADKQLVQKRTGYLLGGVSPLGQKNAHPTWIDESAKDYATIFVSGGRRGLEIELVPQDLAKLTSGSFARLCA